MDPSKDFPPSPREMYMYRPSPQVNGHNNVRSTSPSRGRPPPVLPERKPETQLGARNSTGRSSMSSRGSVSSDLSSPPHSPGFSRHDHHHHQHHNYHPQQQHQHQQQQPHGQQKKYQENKPFSYAVGINPKQAANLHSPEIDMRVRHNKRDPSPHNGRGNVKSEGCANHDDYNRFIHNEDVYSQQQNNAMIYQRIDKGRDRITSAPDALLAGRQGYHQDGFYGAAENTGHSEGVYGQFVQPSANGGHHRPSLTYVPPPVVPTMHSDSGRANTAEAAIKQQRQHEHQQFHHQLPPQNDQQFYHQHQQQPHQHQQQPQQHQMQQAQHRPQHQQQQAPKAPPPPPPVRTSSSSQLVMPTSPQQQHHPRDLNPAPVGLRSPRSGSPSRPPGTAPHHNHKQPPTATLDEIAQVKLRTVSESSQPMSPTSSDATSGAINVKLRPTPGKFSNIYADDETTLPPPPPLDDLDELPPPPPPPELQELGHELAGLHFASAASTSGPVQSHHHNNGSGVPPPPPHHQAHGLAGEVNSTQIHHQHAHQQQQRQQQVPQQQQQIPAPPPLSTQLQQLHGDTNGAGSKVSSSGGGGPSSSDSGTPVVGSAENFTSGLDKIISESVANMDFEVPDDIDLSQCPGLVEINKSTPNWKRSMIEKKNQEKIEEYVKEILKKREQEAKWKNVPEWKRKILQKKEEEDAAAEAAPKAGSKDKPAKKAPPPPPKNDDFEVPKPKGDIVPAALSIDPEELAAMPPWKRELLFKRDKVPITFSNEFNPDEEEGGEAPASEDAS